MPISRPWRAPLGALAAGLVQHPAADLDDQPGLLEQRHEVVGLHDPARRVQPADQGLHARGDHLAKVERGLVDDEELIFGERVAQVHLELHLALDGVVHPGLEHHVAVLALPLGAVHRDVGVAQELFGGRAIAHRDPDAGRDDQSLALGALQFEWLLERGQQSLGDQLGARCQRHPFGDDDELVAAQAPERVDVAHDALQARGDGAQQLVADAVTERVVDALEVVEVDEQRRHRRLAAARAHQHLLHAVEDQRTVGQARERVVGGHEGELLLAATELLVGALALGLEGLAHAHERHVEAALQHRDGSLENRLRQRELLDDFAHEVGGGVAPAQAALGDLVERRRSLCGELAEDAPRLLPDLARHLRALARHPARDRDRRDGSHLLKALFDHRLEHDARFVVASQDALDDLLGALVERTAEHPQVTFELHPGGWRKLLHLHLRLRHVPRSDG